VRSIVDLGRSLGLEAVAEGVEQSDQAAALQDVGCDLGQGFHFARPMDADAIGDLLGITPQAEQGSQASGKGRPAALRPQQGRLSAA
jgi:EAL domain-containing protein (putative c-di-GMP-specific phosphodiesterase class I)